MSKSIISDLAQFYTRNNTNEMGNHMTQELFFCLFTFFHNATMIINLSSNVSYLFAKRGKFTHDIGFSAQFLLLRRMS